MGMTPFEVVYSAARQCPLRADQHADVAQAAKLVVRDLQLGGQLAGQLKAARARVEQLEAVIIGADLEVPPEPEPQPDAGAPVRQLRAVESADPPPGS